MENPKKKLDDDLGDAPHFRKPPKGTHMENHQLTENHL